MSQSILLNIKGIENRQFFNAYNKAREDVELTLVNHGYKVIDILCPTYTNKTKSLLYLSLNTIRAIYSIITGNPKNIIIQYPPLGLGTKILSVIIHILSRYNITLLIHDIISLRYYTELSKSELTIFNKVKHIIVHTNAMKDMLIANGITADIKVLWLFDYYCYKKANAKNFSKQYYYDVTFAGNLDKSKFLFKLSGIISPIRYHLYGVTKTINWGNNVLYEGKFEPNDISNIIGDWGLVWDGDEIDSCTGVLGNYLKYNSSQKVSLYLAAGKPLIIWEKSGLAKYILENKLGICIKNLSELPIKLSQIDKEKYLLLTKAIKPIQEKLIKGGFLTNLIQS